jgi:hypothetical protein
LSFQRSSSNALASESLLIGRRIKLPETAIADSVPAAGAVWLVTASRFDGARRQAGLRAPGLEAVAGAAAARAGAKAAGSRSGATGCGWRRCWGPGGSSGAASRVSKLIALRGTFGAWAAAKARDLILRSSVLRGLARRTQIPQWSR